MTGEAMLTTLASTLAEDPFYRIWFRAPSATEAGRESDSMFMWLWWFCVAWFVLLMGLMVFWAVKYRRRPGKIAERSASHNTPLEIIWTVVPTLFLVWIFFKGFHGYIHKMLSPGDATEMYLTGAKWLWQLNYPNGAETPETTHLGAKDVPVFYMPAKTPIRLKMQSKDVMHAFWVPDFRIKQDVLPNRWMMVWFKADGPDAPNAEVKTHRVVDENSPEGKKRRDLVVLSGKPYTEHRVFCAEYCGDEHSEMAAVIRVVNDDVYRAWLAAIGTPSDPVELGRQVWKTKCASCHTIDGSKGTGPSWKDLYGREEELVGGQKVLVDDAYITESIFDPQKRITKGYENQVMTSFRGLLTPIQLQGVIEFMKSVSTHAPAKPADGGEAPAEKPQGT